GTNVPGAYGQARRPSSEWSRQGGVAARGPYRRGRMESRRCRWSGTAKFGFDWWLLARAIGAGDGVTAQRRDFAGPHGLGHAGQTRFLQLLVYPLSRLVRPADHG